MLLSLCVVALALLYLHPALCTEETPGCGSLRKRLEGLENIVLQQSTQLQLQGAEIERLRHQEELVKQQGEEIERLRHQEELLKQQGEEIERLGKENLVLKESVQKLERGEELRSEGSYQNTVPSLLQFHHKKDGFGEHRPQGRSSHVKDRFLHSAPAGEIRKATTVPSEKQSQVEDMTSSRSSRDLHARADDTDPLAPVVSQVAQRVTEMEAKVSSLETEMGGKMSALESQTAGNFSSLRMEVGEAGSSAYVRWGSSRCASDAQLVYSGVVGGSNYASTGGAANYLCLTMEPVLSAYNPAGDLLAHVYGAEYESHDSHYQQDALCAVCRAPRPTTVMVPGTNRCQAGWVREYSGYLMANYRGFAGASEFVCVDHAMEGRPGTDANLNGKLFYFTTYVCGSLPCHPFVNGKTVVCAVCSK